MKSYNYYKEKAKNEINVHDKEVYINKKKDIKKDMLNLLKKDFMKQNFDFCWNSTLEVFNCIPKQKVSLHKYIILINI